MVVEKGLRILKNEGPLPFFNRLIIFLFRVVGLEPLRYKIVYLYYRLFKFRRQFEFQGRRYRYFYHAYNVTFNNERAIEIPIVKAYIDELEGGDILEVGNVLSHYFDFEHDIVDKYEEGQKVINADIIDYSPEKQYDLVVSISTLEHVGWDREKDPVKIIHAIENIDRLTKPGGKAVVTLPLGYNTYMDDLLKRGELQLGKIYLLKKISNDNRWIELSCENLPKISPEFGKPYSGANFIVVGIMEK